MMRQKINVLFCLIVLSGCVSKSISNNGIKFVSQGSVPKHCTIIDSFQVHSTSKIKSFYSLSNTDLPNQVNIALYNKEEHARFQQKARELEYKKMVEEYFAKNPNEKSLPIDFCCVPTGMRYQDNSIKYFYGVLLSCDDLGVSE